MGSMAGGWRLMVLVLAVAAAAGPRWAHGQTLEIPFEALNRIEKSSTIQMKALAGNAEWLHRANADCQLEFDVSPGEAIWRMDPSRWVAVLPNACVHDPAGRTSQPYGILRNTWREWAENLREDDLMITGVPRIVVDPGQRHRIEIAPVTRIAVVPSPQATAVGVASASWLHNLPPDLAVLDERTLGRFLQSTKVEVRRGSRDAVVTVRNAPVLVTTLVRATAHLYTRDAPGQPASFKVLADGGRRTYGTMVVDGRPYDNVAFLTVADSEANRVVANVTGPVSVVGLLSLNPVGIGAAVAFGGSSTLANPIQVIVLQLQAGAPANPQTVVGPRPIAIQLETRGRGFSAGTPITATIRLVNAENQLASGDRDIVVTLAANGKPIRTVTFQKGGDPRRDESIVLHGEGLVTISATSPDLRGAETKIVLTRSGSRLWPPAPIIRSARWDVFQSAPTIVRVANHRPRPGLIQLELDEAEARVGGGEYATVLGWIGTPATEEIRVTLVRKAGRATFAVPDPGSDDMKLLPGKGEADLVIPKDKLTGTVRLHADQPGIVTLAVGGVRAADVEVQTLEVPFTSAVGLCVEVPDARQRVNTAAKRPQEICPDFGSELDAFDNATVEARLVDALGNPAKTFIGGEVTFTLNGPGRLEPQKALIPARGHSHPERISLRPTAGGTLYIHAVMSPLRATSGKGIIQKTKEVQAIYWSGVWLLFLAAGGLAGMLNYVVGGAPANNGLALPTSVRLLLYFVIGTLAVFVALAGIVPAIPTTALPTVSPLLFRVAIGVVAGWGSVALLNLVVKGWVRIQER